MMRIFFFIFCCLSIHFYNDTLFIVCVFFFCCLKLYYWIFFKCCDVDFIITWKRKFISLWKWAISIKEVPFAPFPAMPSTYAPLNGIGFRSLVYFNITLYYYQYKVIVELSSIKWLLNQNALIIENFYQLTIFW